MAAGREGLKGRHGGEASEEQRRLREAERKIGELTRFAAYSSRVR